MKKLLALLVIVAFTAGAAARVSAQAQKPGEKKAAEKVLAKMAAGTVKSISADSVVVVGKAQGKDTEWTFAVDPRTTVKRGGKGATPGDLKAGDHVTVRYAEQDGKTIAQSINATAKKPEAKPAEKK